jgi:hypothetical protein
MVYKDNHCCGKALNVMIVLTPILVNNPSFHELLGREITIKTLEVMMISG